MGKLRILEPIVKEILEEDPDARKDDMYLYYKYVDKKVGCYRLDEVFFNKDFRKALKISPYHSVARCRRKLQNLYEHLQPSKKVQEARINETSEYIDYSIDGYSSNFIRFVDSQD